MMFETFQTVEETQTAFRAWLEKQLSQFQKYAKAASSQLPTEPLYYQDAITIHADGLGWVNELLPVLKDFLTQAIALATHEVSSSAQWQDRGYNEIKAEAKRRIHEIESWNYAFDRLDASLVHRLDALRSLNKGVRL